jgi:tetraacyldisaccharide 4'-kinase
VGNLSVGGTGKTPMTEYLIKLISKNNMRIAMLSRGYGRKTRGFILADNNANPQTIGDEPMQINKKFPDIKVAVDEKRVRGIDCLREKFPELNCLVLDDALQHRYVKPGLSICLVDYNRPVFNDIMLPAGRLREPAKNLNRADLVVVTKCPGNLSTDQSQQFSRKLKFKNVNDVFFSRMSYSQPVQFSGNKEKPLYELNPLILLCGIANPKPFIEYVQSYTGVITSLEFADHHDYNHKDLQKLNALMDKYSRKVSFLCTEKDYIKLISLIPEDYQDAFYYLPVQLSIMFGKQNAFDQHVLNFTNT